MTGKNGYFNSKAETMKEATKRYISIESEDVMQRVGGRINALSRSGKWDLRIEQGLRESVENALKRSSAKFVEAFNSLLYSEFGDNPTKDVKLIAGEHVARYTALLRDYQRRVNDAQGSFNIRGASMQFSIDAGALSESLLSARRP
ncbi:MAG: hypothetical protein KGH71_05600 [Candidatus Micrarchaeota archaeon]|nr:hypothetical protein [Candidatus Micrarchaeota archaeon]